MTTIGVNTYAYAWTTPADEAVRRLADLGYRSFELLLHPPHLPLEELDAGQRRALAATLRSVDATQCTINMPSLDHNMVSPWARARRASVALFGEVIDLASDLSIPWLVVVPGRVSPLAPVGVAQRTAWMREAIEALLPQARRRGVGLAIENVPMASFPDHAALGDFVRSFADDGVGACYDAANAHFIGESPGEGVRALSDVLRVLHLSDTPRDVWRHDPVGTGTVPFAEVAQAARDIAYRGPTMMEIVAADPEAALVDSHARLAAVGFPPRAAKGTP